MLCLASTSPSSEVKTPTASKMNQTMQVPVLTTTHTLSCDVSHRLWSSELSDRVNDVVYGAAGKQHGHTFVIRVSVQGPLCAATGFVMDQPVLLDSLKLCILDPLDGADVDADVAYFHTRPSTPANLAIFCFRNLSLVLAPHMLKVTRVEVDSQSARCGSAAYEGHSQPVQRSAVAAATASAQQRQGDVSQPSKDNNSNTGPDFAAMEN